MHWYVQGNEKKFGSLLKKGGVLEMSATTVLLAAYKTQNKPSLLKGRLDSLPPNPPLHPRLLSSSAD
ncbi:hypothetical protein FKM82_004053 [Ascaphus truei]